MYHIRVAIDLKPLAVMNETVMLNSVERVSSTIYSDYRIHEEIRRHGRIVLGSVLIKAGMIASFGSAICVLHFHKRDMQRVNWTRPFRRHFKRLVHILYRNHLPHPIYAKHICTSTSKAI